MEPEWEGHVTLEFSNTTTLPAKIYANEGVAQMLFFESDEVCEVSYKDRGGKYQGQRGVTLPKAWNASANNEKFSEVAYQWLGVLFRIDFLVEIVSLQYPIPECSLLKS